MKAGMLQGDADGGARLTGDNGLQLR
jgi:hypothetical protein